MNNKDNELVTSNNAWFPPYKGMAKVVFDWGLNNGYNFVDSEVQDLLAALQNQQPDKTTTLVINQANQRKLDESYNAGYIQGWGDSMEQQPSVNQQMLEALRNIKNKIQCRNTTAFDQYTCDNHCIQLAEQAIANAESIKTHTDKNEADLNLCESNAESSKPDHDCNKTCLTDDMCERNKVEGMSDKIYRYDLTPQGVDKRMVAMETGVYDRMQSRLAEAEALIEELGKNISDAGKSLYPINSSGIGEASQNLLIALAKIQAFNANKPKE